MEDNTSISPDTSSVHQESQQQPQEVYTLSQKNQLFSKIQQMVQKRKLTKQNQVDLHDILTEHNQSFSQNNNGSMYNSSKCNDDTYVQLVHFVEYVEKTIQQQQQQNPNRPTDEPDDLPKIPDYKTNLSTTIFTISKGQAQKIIGDDTVSVTMEPEDDNGVAPMDIDTMETLDQLEERFGSSKMFKTTPVVKFRYQKPEDVTKKNDTYQRVTKKTKKVACIPIQYQEKQITSFATPFNVYRKQYIPASILYGEDEDEDEEDENNEDEDENNEENSEYDYEDEDDENNEDEDNEDRDDGNEEDSGDEEDEEDEDEDEQAPADDDE